MLSRRYLRGFARLLAFTLAASPCTFAQTNSQVVGALRATGDVRMNGNPISGDATIFAGDTLRTGPNGAAGVSVAGRGTLTLAAESEMAFPASPRFLASLRSGSAGLRALAGAFNFQLQVGGFSLVPSPQVESAAEIVRRADGSAQISCISGSFGVIELEGNQTLFLNAGETAVISADGSLRRGGAPASTEPAAPRPPDPKSPPAPTAAKSRRGLAILIVAAGGAAGAALALGGKGASSTPATPVSPSRP